MNRLTVLAIGLLLGVLLGLWVGVNIGKGYDIFASPLQGSTLTES